jgi:hypothetical protein
MAVPELAVMTMESEAAPTDRGVKRTTNAVNSTRNVAITGILLIFTFIFFSYYA